MNNKLGKILGKGGDGVIYEYGEDKIIKFIQPSYFGFSNYLEAYILLHLKHPNLKEALAIEIAENSLIKIVQSRATKDLSKLIGERKIKKERRLSYIKDIITGLFFLHSYNIIHGDLKPSNILIENEQAKLNDFSRSRFSNSRKTNQILYTFNYRPPEAYKKKITLASDIWALGCSLYEIYYNKNYFQLLGNDIHHFECFEEQKECNAGFNQLIKKMVSKRAQDRPTIGEIIDFFDLKIKKEERNLVVKQIDHPDEVIFNTKIYQDRIKKSLNQKYKIFERRLCNELKFDIFVQN